MGPDDPSRRVRIQPPPRRQTWLRRLGWVVALGVFGYLTTVVVARWDQVQGAGGLPDPAPSTAAVVLYLLGNMILAYNWRALVAMTGTRLSLSTAFWAWSSSQIARYLVSLGQVGGRALSARRHGISGLAGAATAALELGWYLAMISALLLATLPWWSPGDVVPAWIALVGAVPVAAMIGAVIHPAGVVTVATGAARIAWLPARTRDKVAALEAKIDIDRGVTLGLTLRYAANSLLRISAYLTLVTSVSGWPGERLPEVLGAYAVGNFLGAVAVFAPGGLGVREGATALLLRNTIGTEAAIVVVAAVRLLEVVAELIFLATSRIAYDRSSRHLRPDRARRPRGDEGPGSPRPS